MCRSRLSAAILFKAEGSLSILAATSGALGKPLQRLLLAKSAHPAARLCEGHLPPAGPVDFSRGLPTEASLFVVD